MYQVYIICLLLLLLLILVSTQTVLSFTFNSDVQCTISTGAGTLTFQTSAWHNFLFSELVFNRCFILVWTVFRYYRMSIYIYIYIYIDIVFSSPLPHLWIITLPFRYYINIEMWTTQPLFKLFHCFLFKFYLFSEGILST